MSEFAPALHADGASNGYTSLAAKLKALQEAADALQDHAQLVKARMRRNADSAADWADLCAAADIDERHTGAIGDVSAAFARVAGGGARLVSAADVLGHAAGHLKAQHQAEYGGLHEVASTSRVRPPKPGFLRQP